jgi:hypothetical protein
VIEKRKLLDAPIPREHVEERQQSGMTLSYIAGWRVIAELNRIFPEGWSYDAGDTREVAREQEEKGRWRVSYSCRCVLEAGGVRVVDRGHGHGIDRYVGAAVESAEKEAATDALYDKAQEHVAEPALTVSDEEQEGVVEQWPRQTEAWKRLVWPTLLPEMKQRIKDLKKESAK